MNKTELAAALAEKTGSSKADAAKVINALFDVNDGIIVTAARSGDKVQITGFGSFEQKAVAAKVAKNPQTGVAVNVPARNVVKFKGGTGLRQNA